MLYRIEAILHHTRLYRSRFSLERLLFKRGYYFRAVSDQANTVVGAGREEGRGRKEVMGGKGEDDKRKE